MSVKNMTWAWDLDMPPVEKLVLLAIADHTNDQDNTCWPSFTHLQKKTGLSRPTISRKIEWLVSKHVLAKIGQKYQATLYQLNISGKPSLLVNQINWLKPEQKWLTPLTEVVNVRTQVVNLVNPNHKEPSLTIIEPSLRGARPRDLIWETIIDVCGLQDKKTTKSERGAWNSAVKELKDAGATPEEIKHRAQCFQQLWPGISMTPTALARRWNECIVQPAVQKNGQKSELRKLAEMFANDIK